MGIWELVSSTAEAVKRKAPDAAPVKNAFTKITEPVKTACRNSYNSGSSAFAKIDHTVRTIRLRRTTADEINFTYEKIPVEEVEEAIGETAAPVKTNTCNYGGKAFAKIEEAVATPLKSVCRNSCSYGFVTFAKFGYTVRVKVVYRIVRWISDDGTKTVIGIYATNLANESEDGNKLITGQDVGMPVKSKCKDVYTVDLITFARIGYVVRVEGLYRISQWIKDPDTKSRIIWFTSILARNARKHASQHGYKFIHGGGAFFIILSKTLIDVVIEIIEASKEKVGSSEMHGKGVEYVSSDGYDYFSAAYNSLKDKLGVFAVDEVLVFMVKEFRAFLGKEPFRTQFLSKGVLKMEALVFMMREFFVFMMKQLFGNQFFSGIDEILLAVLREVFGITLFNEPPGFYGSATKGTTRKKGKRKC